MRPRRSRHRHRRLQSCRRHQLQRPRQPRRRRQSHHPMRPRRGRCQSHHPMKANGREIVHDLLSTKPSGAGLGVIIYNKLAPAL
ncbi:hypothetical protein K491DRAFT_341460 [Lophiostoma macrostomum CBS 122681]|uniref:Uncharacterized protein n=1 Tax=Lophiostoma macrostomum CBS 122681 TaxID=1314788 RepID=A0A6A6TDY2_9PLEO|nr:hypothetical protein K491DRAFT_341460 [Lophiostoma macrostomum CBS 122681]